MSKKGSKLDENRILNLIDELKTDFVSGIPIKDREEAKTRCNPKALIFNLIRSNKYKFSYREYEEIFNRLIKEL